MANDMHTAVCAELKEPPETKGKQNMVKRINCRFNKLWNTARVFAKDRNLTKDSAVTTYLEDADGWIRVAFGLNIGDKVTKEQKRSWVVRVACVAKLECKDMPKGSKCIRFPANYQVPESLRCSLPDNGNVRQFHILS